MLWVVYHEFGVDYVLKGVPEGVGPEEIRSTLMKAGMWPQRGHSPWERFIQQLEEAPCTVWDMIKHMPPHEVPFKVIAWDKVEQKATELPDFVAE